MLPNSLIDFVAANKSWDDPPPSDGANVREMARRLRCLARDCRLPGARREMLDLAARFERRADYFDSRHAAEHSTSVSRCLAETEPAY
jgi:hypothetical protein